MRCPAPNRSAKYFVLGPGTQEAPADTTGFEVRRCPTFNMFVGIRITVTDPKEAAALPRRSGPIPTRSGPTRRHLNSSRRRGRLGAACRRAAWTIGGAWMT